MFCIYWCNEFQFRKKKLTRTYDLNWFFLPCNNSRKLLDNKSSLHGRIFYLGECLSFMSFCLSVNLEWCFCVRYFWKRTSPVLAYEGKDHISDTWSFSCWHTFKSWYSFRKEKKLSFVAKFLFIVYLVLKV